MRLLLEFLLLPGCADSIPADCPAGEVGEAVDVGPKGRTSCVPEHKDSYAGTTESTSSAALAAVTAESTTAKTPWWVPSAAVRYK